MPVAGAAGAALNVLIELDRVAVITAWLRTSATGLRLIVGTYASADRPAEAVRAAGTPLDLLVLDEAHHLTGRADQTSRRCVDRAHLPPPSSPAPCPSPRSGSARIPKRCTPGTSTARCPTRPVTGSGGRDDEPRLVAIGVAGGERAQDRWLREAGLWTPDRAAAVELAAYGDRAWLQDRPRSCPDLMALHDMADDALDQVWERLTAALPVLLRQQAMSGEQLAECTDLPAPAASPDFG
ncbi:hypothetical protein [Kitasatospora sp. NPDC085879]|jgi:hypothetical protein|uniref:hypothetical protein n=1 Tax=Kitasatospora sp. NPDC085879 TaxID=3154769 RepID=UPI0034412810